MPSNKKKIKKKSYKRKSLKKSSYKKRGGVVLGIGATGCVINPNISCKNYMSDNKYISKLINNDDVNMEYNIIKILELNKLPNFEKYIIVPLEVCDMKLDYTKEDRNNIYKKHKLDIVECINKFPRVDNMFKTTNIIQEYGGISFAEYRKNNMNQTIEENVPYYVQLFKAVIFLNNNGIVHRDIKHPNIVIDTNNKTVRLIDFGLAMNIDDIFNVENQQYITFFNEDIYYKGYYIWPIELYVFCNMYNDKSTPLNYINKQIITNYYNEYKDFIIPTADNYKYEKAVYNHINQINDIIKNIHKYGTNIKEKYEWKKECNSKLDVFSLGTFFMREIKLLEKNSPNNNFINLFKDLVYDSMLIQNCKARHSIDFVYHYFTQICDDYNIRYD
jgi:serine/threonine protein kinase